MAAKGPYGQQNPKKLPKWTPTPEPAPAVVSRGTLSRPTKPGKWSPKTLPQDAAPTIVQR